MTKEQVLAQQRADFAVAKFIEEILGSGHIKEYTFDETRDSALECAKQNIEASSLTEREKHVAKESVDKAVHEIAKIFKKGMIQSGRFGKGYEHYSSSVAEYWREGELWCVLEPSLPYYRRFW